jgi:hypothetical protein
MDVGKVDPPTARTVAPSQSWLRAVIFGLAYFVVGIVTSSLPASDQGRVIRLAAWAASSVLYAAHIGYEHFGLRNSPRSVALHAAIAVASGALGLAVAATLHALLTAHFRPAYLVAMVAWPAITAFPALLVALAVSALLARLRRR